MKYNSYLKDQMFPEDNMFSYQIFAVLMNQMLENHHITKNLVSTKSLSLMLFSSLVTGCHGDVARCYLFIFKVFIELC